MTSRLCTSHKWRNWSDDPKYDPLMIKRHDTGVSCNHVNSLPSLLSVWTHFCRDGWTFKYIVSLFVFPLNLQKLFWSCKIQIKGSLCKFIISQSITKGTKTKGGRVSEYLWLSLVPTASEEKSQLFMGIIYFYITQCKRGVGDCSAHLRV